ncbi:MAG: hypothetical protein J6U44_00275 [Paludibacteraceae bacterium]|nr:hypothetical protein [Paludibacteraceae bacterium]
MGKYKFTFQNIGGSTRVKLQSGEDLCHLAELDEKMWTVLSCPTKGLHIDEKTLDYIDTNSDERIHVNEVIAAAQWLTSVVKNPDEILEGKSSIALSQINIETEIGKKLYKSATEILKNLGKTTEEISIADTADSLAIFSKTRFNGDGVITNSSADSEEQKKLIDAIIATVGGCTDRSGEMGVNAEQIEAFYKALADYSAWQKNVVEAPFGDDTDKAITLYNALDAKIKDFFLRSKLAAFDANAAAALDVQVSRIEAISAENLTEKLEEIASYPIARINADSVIDLSATINPVWADKFLQLKSIAFAKKKTLSEADWISLGKTFESYIAWKSAKAGEVVESLGMDTIQQLCEENKKDELLEIVEHDKALAEEANEIGSVDKLLHLYRDFFTLLKNFVTFQDFYSTDKTTKAIFQAGKLVIDQRACHLCIKVTDMAKQNTMAAASGMYLIFCDCVCKQKAEKLQIVAAMTQGDTGDLMVGKNAIFYDRDGLDWDAVVTKIIDNPISISQAFWSPYRRISTWVENLINKRAAEKDSKMMEEATAKLSATPELKPADGSKAATPVPPFDIAKFAGIFAAIGMALGMIGTALVSVAEGFAALTWWQCILVFVGIILFVSGPSMVMAWLKLRRRNIAQILNANGWAMNASSIVNITFGGTLKEIANFPKIKMQDPFAKKKMPAWKKWLRVISVLLVLAGAAVAVWFYFDNKKEVATEKPCVEQEQVIAEEVATEVAE